MLGISRGQEREQAGRGQSGGGEAAPQTAGRHGQEDVGERPREAGGGSRVLEDRTGGSWDKKACGKTAGREACAVTASPRGFDSDPGTWLPLPKPRVTPAEPTSHRS